MNFDKLKNWKSDPSKGEVFTPVELVSEMLDKIPNRVWQNPKSTFLDPCMGKGTFLVEIVRRLTYIYGYTETNAKSRVFGYDIRVKYINHLKRRGFVNVRHKDFLNEIIEMQFDVIVGNPPYQNIKSESDAGKLYIDITKKSLSLIKENGIVSFLTPETIVRDGRNKFNIKNIIGLSYVNHKVGEYFDVGVKIISWMINKTHNGPVSVVNQDGSCDLREITESMMNKEDLLGIRIFEKLKQQKNKLFIVDQSATGFTESFEDGMYAVNKNVNKNKISYTKVRPKLHGRRKLVISMSSSYSLDMVHESFEDFGELHVMLDITDYSNQQIENVKNFLFNPICIQICNKYKKLYKKGFNSMLYLFPPIDINKKYNNEDVVKLFDLTSEEVNYLLS